MKQIVESIFRETLASLDIGAALDRKLARAGSRIAMPSGEIDLRDFSEIVVVAYGKASEAMARGLAAILAPKFTVDGILVTPTVTPLDLPGWKIFTGGHPLPNAESFAAGHAILERLGRCDEKSLVIFLLSGGGSALVEQPLPPSITLEDFRELNALLVGCGAPIEEINAVRKHLSATKGGRLAAAASKSRTLTLAITDVPAHDVSALASGPTLPDPTTADDAYRVVSEYGLLGKLPASIRSIFEQKMLKETPKAGDPAFARAEFSIALGQHELMHAAHHACESHGFICVCDYATDNWPLEKAADYLLDLLAQHQKENHGQRVALLASGEVQSPVTGNGIGGRNAAFVLTCARKIAGRRIAILSVGTDGIDGNSPAAGAYADGETFVRARSFDLDERDFLQRCDAFTYFNQLDDAFITGPTGNNLRDLRIFLSY